MCLYPKLIKNPKYKSNKKNGGNIPAVTDIRTLYVPIGCEQCIECRKQKTRGWQVRLLEDLRENKNGKFVAFTFSNEELRKLRAELPQSLEGYELDNAIATVAVHRFRERWRKKYKKSIRHWLVTELGHEGTEHIHLHGIIWTDESLEEVERIWKYGFMWKGKPVWKGGKIIRYDQYVSERTVNYTVKYINKIDYQHKFYKSIILTSPGIGSNYMKRTDKNNNKYNGSETDECYRTRTGHKISMPIYYRNKIYSEQEKEKLWIHKLDKEERWVLGERVDISKGHEGYFKMLNEARIKNKRLGYGSDERDWKRRTYENQIRILKQKARLNSPNVPPGNLKVSAPPIAPPGNSGHHTTDMLPQIKTAKAPSAGSIQKGLDYILQPPKEKDTSDVERRKNQVYRRTDVAPAAGCERLHNLIMIHDSMSYEEMKERLRK